MGDDQDIRNQQALHEAIGTLANDLGVGYTFGNNPPLSPFTSALPSLSNVERKKWLEAYKDVMKQIEELAVYILMEHDVRTSPTEAERMFVQSQPEPERKKFAETRQFIKTIEHPYLRMDPRLYKIFREYLGINATTQTVVVPRVICNRLNSIATGMNELQKRMFYRTPAIHGYSTFENIRCPP
jgi:hypothetical protein